MIRFRDTASGTKPLLEVEDLRVRFGADGPEVVRGVSFSLHAGECLALVGESGSGKSVVSRSLVGLAGHGARTDAAVLRFDGEDLRDTGERRWRRIRGDRIGFVMQDALGSLDPLRLVGEEVGEPLKLHRSLARSERAERVIELLRSVGVPEPEVRAKQHPFQLSGGLRQRAIIASAIACDPKLIIADEPTTALDAAVQAQVLALLERLRNKDTALLLVSHDLAVVSRLADRVAVMRHGVIVEQGPVREILEHPQHPYTKSLLAAADAVHGVARPRFAVTAVRAGEPEAETVLRAEGVVKSYEGPDRRRRVVVNDVSFALRRGETIGIVGESGSGKTTLTRIALGLVAPDSGRIELRGRDWTTLSQKEKRAERRRIQVVFQDPLASFDPRYTVRRVLYEALAVAGHPRGELNGRAVALLNLVRLGEKHLDRRPLELSGGQRQRVAIARALAPNPEVLVCDEPVSALDVSVQAQVLDLLADLKEQLGLSCLFISHDLGVIRRVSDRILVMKDGRLVESGTTEDIFNDARHDYTRTLLDAIPRIEAIHV